ncbi:MAG: TIGR03088 family PEP-CTERM/XrtA system glycosyltransferase [Nitrosomonas sp.]|nr:TIGR03088 family PEP-CTERM/XrtA system glycosyltransferase [Nitrosomonas sp.]
MPDVTPLVLHVIHHLSTGGLENGLVNIINKMPESAYRHAIVCVEDYSDFRHRIQRQNVDVIALHRSQIGVWKMQRELYALCRRLRPSIIHTRNQSGLDALLPAWLARVPHRIHGEHGWDVDNIDGKKYKPALLRRLHAPLVNRYVTVSKHLANYLATRVGIDTSRITQIYNGVDTEKFYPAKNRTSDLLPRSFQGSDLVIIGTVGRVQAVKDQAALLKTFAVLRTKHPDLYANSRLVVVGDGPLLADLRQLAKNLLISDLTWFAGAQENIPDWLRLMDIFVLPSLNEGISNTLLEAMASGIPVVATRVGGNPELVEVGRNGDLFACGDQSALLEILIRYIQDRQLRSVYGEESRKIVLQRFSLSGMIERYQQIYDQFCQKN